MNSNPRHCEGDVLPPEAISNTARRLLRRSFQSLLAMTELKNHVK